MVLQIGELLLQIGELLLQIGELGLRPFFRQGGAAADRVDVRAQLGEEGASRRSRRACPASESPASPQSRTQRAFEHILAPQRARRHGALECSTWPLMRVLRSLSTRAAMDGLRFYTVVRTPLARGDARLVRSSNNHPAGKAAAARARCSCCSSLTIALFSSRALAVSQRPSISATRTRSARATATRRRTRRSAPVRCRPYSFKLLVRRHLSPCTWRASSPRATAGARGGAADERAAGARAAGGESTIAWTVSSGGVVDVCGGNGLRLVEIMCE